nr:tyrosine-type recombinase/integrase [Methylobacterium sp. WL6]
MKRFWQSHRDGSKYQPEGSTQVSSRPFPDSIDIVADGTQGRAASSQAPSPVSIDRPAFTVIDLFERWATYSADKRAANTIKRYRGSFRSLAAFAKERDVRSLTGDDVFAWAERRRDMEGVSARAINKNDLVAVSSVFRWASSRSGGQFLASNPVTGISLDAPRIVAQRERTFRGHEIAAILSAASAVQPDDQNPTRAASRRWCPWLAAYSGARITELTNLEKRDIRTEAGILFMDLRVTKTGEPRTVPLHAHLIEQGFLVFVQASLAGPLFYDPKRHRKCSSTPPGELQGHKVAKWIRDTLHLDPCLSPNHGWRHTWKTRALGAGIEERLRDAVTGHRVASVGRRYETPTLTMLGRAMHQFPRYGVGTIDARAINAPPSRARSSYNPKSPLV